MTCVTNDGTQCGTTETDQEITNDFDQRDRPDAAATTAEVSDAAVTVAPAATETTSAPAVDPNLFPSSAPPIPSTSTRIIRARTASRSS